MAGESISAVCPGLSCLRAHSRVKQADIRKLRGNGFQRADIFIVMYKQKVHDLILFEQGVTGHRMDLYWSPRRNIRGLKFSKKCPVHLLVSFIKHHGIFRSKQYCQQF